MITTTLILLPIAAALAIWIVPWSTPRAAGGFALLVALGELALWVGTALNFDFAGSGLQEEVDVLLGETDNEDEVRIVRLEGER